jgi:DNA-directed RNA polymerase specialized sigma24 family protein
MTREGFGQAYSRGFELTIRFLTSRGLRRGHASEVAQAAWVRGWERIGQLRDERFVLTWVNTIALNVYRKLIRTDPLNRTVPDFDDRIANIKTVGINLAAIDVTRLLAACRPSDRFLLEQQMHGVTPAEIAQEEGVTQTAIRIRLLRARREARSRIESGSYAKCSGSRTANRDAS